MRFFSLLYIVALLLSVVFSSMAHAKSYTEDHYWANNPFMRDRNPRKPRTIYGVHKAYRAFVFRKNGIDPAEARIIAQYRLIEEHREQGFDFRKPQLMTPTDDYYVVRFPGKYSVMFKKVNIFIYHIGKTDGRILAGFEQDVPVPAE